MCPQNGAITAIHFFFFVTVNVLSKKVGVWDTSNRNLIQVIICNLTATKHVPPGHFWMDLLKTDSSPPTVWPTNNRAVRNMQVLMCVGLSTYLQMFRMWRQFLWVMIVIHTQHCCVRHDTPIMWWHHWNVKGPHHMLTQSICHMHLHRNHCTPWWKSTILSYDAFSLVGESQSYSFFISPPYAPIVLLFLLQSSPAEIQSGWVHLKVGLGKIKY